MSNEGNRLRRKLFYSGSRVKPGMTMLFPGLVYIALSVHNLSGFDDSGVFLDRLGGNTEIVQLGFEYLEEFIIVRENNSFVVKSSLIESFEEPAKSFYVEPV